MHRRLIPLLFLLLGTAVAALASPVALAADAQVPTQEGLTGLIRVPTTDLMPDAMVRFHYVAVKGPLSRNFGGVSKYGVTFTPLPRTELAWTMGDGEWGHDLTLHGKLVLLKESLRYPALAIGVSDIKRTQNPGKATEFVVATKHLYDDRLGLTLGAALGNAKGVLAGASYTVGNSVQVAADYDTKDINTAVALLLPPHGMIRLQHCNDLTALSYAVQFGMTAPKPLALPALAPVPASANDAALVTHVQEAAIAQGFENVRATLDTTPGGKRLTLAYENRRYTLNDLDSTAALLPVLAAAALADVKTLALVLSRNGVPTLTLATDADAYRRYAAGTLPPADFAAQLTTRVLRDLPTGTPVADSGRANNAAKHTDLIFGVGMRTEIGTEFDDIAFGLAARAETNTPLADGLTLTSRMSTPYAMVGHLGQAISRDFQLNRVLAAYAACPLPGVLAQVMGGRYFVDIDGTAHNGVHAELAVPISRFAMAHATAASLWSGGERTDYALGELWRLIPRLNTQIRLSGGKYLNGDVGGGVDLLRFFNEVELGLGVRYTRMPADMPQNLTAWYLLPTTPDRNNLVATIRVVVPMSPRKQPLKPGTLRVRTPDVFDWRYTSNTHGANYTALANTLANELFTGSDLLETMLNRNRVLSGAVQAYYANGRR
jgi:hypothetical protein